MDNYELFRNDLITKLSETMPQDQIINVLKAFDVASSGYDISRKPLDLITTEGTPDVVKWYIASKAVSNTSKGTLQQYRYKLIDFFKAVRKPFQDIQPNDIRVYLFNFKKERNASDRYLESIRITLNGFFTWLVENEYLIRNPCARVEKIRFQPKQREPLTPYELETIRWNTANVREKAVIDFLFSTGCRVSECADVRLSDINFDDRSVLIRNGKGGKPRTVFFNAEAELSMRKYLETRSDDTDALFVNTRAPHQALKKAAIENIVAAIGERSGLTVFPHKLRHTFATSGLRGGMSLERLQTLMGHANPRTTLIYAKLDSQELQREHQRIYA